MKEIARKLRKTATKSEEILWEALRNRGLDNYKFRRQHPIASFVVDFFCHQQNLIVEVDGSIHDLPEQQELDRQRQQILESMGYGFVRVSAHEVETDLPQVFYTIRNALNSPVLVEEELGVRLKEEALLSIKVCDPACGSGHFLLAAARRIGKELARVRTGELQPSPEPLRQAIRDVIQHCIYGVDLNPLAVDLCKVALWLEGLCKGFSLNFLDHRIKCGNSLVGVMDLEVLKETYS
jgi:very-short-patch-repair endonuclease